MAYSTIAKIRQEAGFQNNDNVDDPLITQFMNSATNVVNGYVGRRYSFDSLSVNFTGSQAAAVLEEAERLMAAGKLMLQQYQGQQMGETNGQEKIDAAQKLLDDIAAGTLKLLDSTNSVFSADVAAAAGLAAVYTAPPRTDADPTSSERKFSVDKKW